MQTHTQTHPLLSSLLFMCPLLHERQGRNKARLFLPPPPQGHISPWALALGRSHVHTDMSVNHEHRGGGRGLPPSPASSKNQTFRRRNTELVTQSCSQDSSSCTRPQPQPFTSDTQGLSEKIRPNKHTKTNKERKNLAPREISDHLIIFLRNNETQFASQVKPQALRSNCYLPLSPAPRHETEN